MEIDEVDELQVLAQSLTTDSSDAVEIWENCSAWERSELAFHGICERRSDLWKWFIVDTLKTWGDSIEWFDADGIAKELIGYNEHAGYYYVKDVPDEWDGFEKYFVG